MNHGFESWVEAHKNDCFRYWIHKIMFTPYEEEEKFSDQSCFENDECEQGYIVDYAILPDNDIMIGFSSTKDKTYIDYYKLSNIDLALSSKDNDDEE